MTPFVANIHVLILTILPSFLDTCKLRLFDKGMRNSLEQVPKPKSWYSVEDARTGWVYKWLSTVKMYQIYTLWSVNIGVQGRSVSRSSDNWMVTLTYTAMNFTRRKKRVGMNWYFKKIRIGVPPIIRSISVDWQRIPPSPNSTVGWVSRLLGWMPRRSSCCVRETEEVSISRIRGKAEIGRASCRERVSPYV